MLIYRKQQILRRLFIFLLILITLTLIIDSQLRPFIKNIAATQAEIVSINAINETILDEVSSQNTKYEELVSVQYADGKVCAIESNTNNINMLKSALVSEIQNELGEYKDKKVGIPLGTLLGSDLLMGRGPKIPLKISLAGSVYAEIESDFASAGINQTKHQIQVNIKTKVFAMIPGYTATTDVSTNLIIAETVIVGEVPNVYASVDGENTDIINEFLQMAK